MRCDSASALIPAGAGSRRRRRQRGAGRGRGRRPRSPVRTGSTDRRDLVRQPLDVQQVPRRDVVRRDVAAVAAAAERHRRVEPGRQPDRPVRRRRVDDDAERRLLQAELEDDLLVLRVDRHRVAHAAVPQDLLAALAALAPVADDVEGEDRAELLDRERVVAADARRAAAMSTRVSGGTVMPHFSAMTGADLPTSAGLGSRCGVTSTRATASISAVVQEVAALRLELALDLLGDRLVDDDRVLRRAQHAVVERLAGDDVAHGLRDVRRSARCSAGALPGPTP